jgi:membrane dipeptidase
MIEALYPFGLSESQEAQAMRLHEDSIIIDMLFQGPIGTYSLGEDIEKETLDLARQASESAVGQIEHASSLIQRWFTGGRLDRLYRECWYDSGLTAGNRQLSVSSRDELFSSAIAVQREFDTKPWLIKVQSASDIESAKAHDLKAGIITCQETMGFGKDLSLLETFHGFGLRVVQLSYNNHNLIGAGCMEENNAGLSSFGVKFVQKLNRLGIVVDTGHCGKQTTLDACRVSSKPVIASHTAAEAVHFHARAKSDEEILAIARTGGVIGVFAMPWFIAPDPENTTIEHYLDHIDHIVRLAGVDHAGIGTDWPMPQTKWMAIAFKDKVAPKIGFKPGDGPSTEFVKGMKDCRSMLNVTRGLVARGYSDQDVSKILGGNWMRVFSEVW